MKKFFICVLLALISISICFGQTVLHEEIQKVINHFHETSRDRGVQSYDVVVGDFISSDTKISDQFSAVLKNIVIENIKMIDSYFLNLAQETSDASRALDELGSDVSSGIISCSYKVKNENVIIDIYLKEGNEIITSATISSLKKTQLENLGLLAISLRQNSGTASIEQYPPQYENTQRLPRTFRQLVDFMSDDRNSAFSLSLYSQNVDTLKTRYTTGEIFDLIIKPDIDSYIIVFHVDTFGSFSVLYPKYLNEQKIVKAQESFIFPDAQRDNGYWRVSENGEGSAAIFVISMCAQDGSLSPDMFICQEDIINQIKIQYEKNIKTAYAAFEYYIRKKSN